MNSNASASSNPSAAKAYRPIAIIFLITNAGLFAARSMFQKWGVEMDVVLIGNVILFIAASISFYFFFKSLQNNKPHAFLKFIYAGMFFKLMVCLLSAFLYIIISGKAVNKPAIFICLGFYVIYTIAEVTGLMKLSKQKKNA